MGGFQMRRFMMAQGAEELAECVGDDIPLISSDSLLLQPWVDISRKSAWGGLGMVQILSKTTRTAVQFLQSSRRVSGSCLRDRVRAICRVEGPAPAGK